MENQSPLKPTPPDSAASQPAPRIALYPAEGIGRLTVEIESFVALNVWMDMQLDALEEQFAGFQTPRVSSRRRNCRG